MYQTTVRACDELSSCRGREELAEAAGLTYQMHIFLEGCTDPEMTRDDPDLHGSDRARRRESDWQRRVLFVAEGNTMKVEIGQACWPGKIRGRLLESLGAWEKEYGIESVFISPAENPEDPSIGYIWVKGHPERLANAEEGLRAIIGRLFPGAVFGKEASSAAEGARRGREGADEAARGTPGGKGGPSLRSTMQGLEQGRSSSCSSSCSSGSSNSTQRVGQHADGPTVWMSAMLSRRRIGPGIYVL